MGPTGALTHHFLSYLKILVMKGMRVHRGASTKDKNYKKSKLNSNFVTEEESRLALRMLSCNINLMGDMRLCLYHAIVCLHREVVCISLFYNWHVL